MGLPRLILPDRNIDFPEAEYRKDVHYTDARIYNVAQSGKTETLTGRAEVFAEFDWYQMSFQDATDFALHRKIQQWWKHAVAGGVWSFARDSAKTVHTTLSADAAVGASNVIVTSATGIMAGQQYVLRSDTRTQLVAVSSIASAPSIALSEPLLFDFDAGAVFRDEYYLFGEVVDPEDFPIQKVPADNYNVLLRFRESRN